MFRAIWRAVKDWYNLPPIDSFRRVQQLPYLERPEYVPPPNVEWVEHPVVVLNSHVKLYDRFWNGKSGIFDDSVPYVEKFSNDYLIVDQSEEDCSRHWVCPETSRMWACLMGKPVGYELKYMAWKGPFYFTVLAVHVPRDGRRFRLAELIPKT